MAAIWLVHFGSGSGEGSLRGGGGGGSLGGGVAVIAVLPVADVATSSLVRVPTFNPIGHVVIEKFHRFEDGMLISLSLCLVSAAIPPALLFAWALRRRS